MRFHFRKTWRPGPFRITLTEKGLSHGIRVGRYGYNPKTRTHTFDTPGLGGVRWGGRRRSRGSGTGSSPTSSGGGVFGALFVVVILGALAFVVLSGWPL